MLAIVLAAGALAGPTAGCWYNTTGRSGANVGDIYIPFFKDETTGERAINLGTRLTDRVIREFEKDRSIRIYQGAAERSLAQKELLGTVKRFSEGVLTRNPDAQGEEYRVVITCSIHYKEVATDKSLWQAATLSGDGNYRIEQGDSGFSAAVDEALDEIVAQIVDKTIKAW